MPKVIQIEARTRNGERGVVSKTYPLNLNEAVEMYGEMEVFKAFIRDRVIIDQREARPEKTGEENGEVKPKRRLSVYDRLNQS